MIRALHATGGMAVEEPRFMALLVHPRADTLAAFLASEGGALRRCPDLGGACALATELLPDLVVLELDGTTERTVDDVARLRRSAPTSQIAVIAEVPDPARIATILGAGADDVISPHTPHPEYQARLRRLALPRRRLARR